MQLHTANPAPSGTGLAKGFSLAGTPSENTIPSVIVNRLQRRFGLSEQHALTVLRLASLGPQEGRN